MHHDFLLKTGEKKSWREKKKSNAFCWPIDQFDAAAAMISSAAEEEALSNFPPTQNYKK